MIPLAVTSTAWAIRKMGGKNWILLHRLIYISAVAGVVHFWWKVKADHREPAVFAVIVAALLAYRIAIWARSRIVARPAAAPKTALVGE
jgi:sulfoxide reductase heme-binding subunit YedZ